MARKMQDRAGPSGVEGSGGTRTVLVVSRTRQRGADLAGCVQEHGLPAAFASKARQAVFWVREISPALVVIDMRAERARLLVEHFRHEERAVFAVSDDPLERTRALEVGCVGADPEFPPEEQAHRIVSLIRERRLRRRGSITATPLVVDLSAKRLIWRGKVLRVPPKVLELAACLADHAGEFVSIETILDEVWSEPWALPDKVHRAVWRLRRALGLRPRDGFLVGKWGYGYGLFPETTASSSDVGPRRLAR